MILNNKRIFISSRDSRFFYKLNKALKNLKIQFKVLDLRDIYYIPPNSILLTTTKEAKKLNLNQSDSIKIVKFQEGEDFNKYLFNVLKIYRCGLNSHSKILFSIDPGKTIGLIVFLDGHFFYSKTFYSDDKLISNINQCIEYISENNDKRLKIIFKFGRGVLSLTLKLIKKIYDLFQEDQKEDIRIFLINESKSSKLKLHRVFKTLSKHEASALILALRKGIEVNQENYEKFFKLKKTNREIQAKMEEELAEISFLNQHRDILIDLTMELLNGAISIYKAYKVINQKTNSHIFIES
jgi:rubrerythrin